MNGKIYFESIEDMSEFLKHFQGSTALFEITFDGVRYVLQFTGSY